MKKFHCVDCNMDLSLVRIHQLQQSIHYRCLCLTVFGVFNFINRGMCEDVSWYGVKVQPHLERDSILVMCMWMNEIKINMADLNKINNYLTFFLNCENWSERSRYTNQNSITSIGALDAYTVYIKFVSL